MGKKGRGSPEDTSPASPREPISVLRARPDSISPFFVARIDQWLQRGPFDDLFPTLEVESQLSLSLLPRGALLLRSMQPVELSVGALLLQELLVGATLDNSSLFQD